MADTEPQPPDRSPRRAPPLPRIGTVHNAAGAVVEGLFDGTKWIRDREGPALPDMYGIQDRGALSDSARDGITSDFGRAELAISMDSDSDDNGKWGAPSKGKLGLMIGVISGLTTWSSDSDDYFSTDEDDMSGEDEDDPFVRAGAQYWRYFSLHGWMAVIMSYLIILLVPMTVFLLIFGLIPLQDPDDTGLSGGWVWVCFVNPMIMTTIAYLNMVLFNGTLNVKRPFEVHVPTLVAVYVIQVAIFALLTHFFDTLPAQGVIAIVITYICTFSGEYIHKQSEVHTDPRWNRKFRSYAKVVVCIVVHILLLIGYIYAFARSPSWLQPILAAALGIVTFVFRKVLLAITDVFPIEMAMLMSALWIENMEDMFAVMAYPNVNDYSTYFYLWVLNFLGNIANLIFLTRPWFIFRVWIKAALGCKWCKKGCCKNACGLGEYDDDKDDRGHGNNRWGYLRRQMRFIFWKFISQIVSAVFFILMVTVLRYGYNSEFYPFSEDPVNDEVNNDSLTLNRDDFFAATVYCLVFLLTIVAALATQGITSRLFCPHTFQEFAFKQVELGGNSNYVGFTLGIIVHNGLVVLSVLMYQYRIWWVLA